MIQGSIKRCVFSGLGKCLILCLFGFLLRDLPGQSQGGNLVLVQNRVAQAAIVVADSASEIAKYAAGELQFHVEKATGVRLPLLRESDAALQQFPHGLYIGATLAAEKRGIRPPDQSLEGYRIQSVDNNLYIVGEETELSPGWWVILGPGTAGRGTLYGVNRLLNKHLGVRWLWQGETGIYVPKRDSWVLPEVHEEGRPDLLFSIWYHSSYNEEISTFLQRHCFSRAHMPPVGHTFQNWWKEYGESHPDWFMLNSEGKRGPNAGDTVAPMCVSNPELHRFIVEQKWDGKAWLTLGEVDRVDACQCERCQSWDVKVPETPADSRNYSDRYGRFWQEVYKLARVRNPDVRISVFFYWQTFPAPAGTLELNDRFFGMFVPWSGKNMWFPMPDAELDKVKKQWQGWSQTGAQMAYWSNCMHGGYALPFLSTRQVGDFIHFINSHGNVGFFGDSYFSNFATKGPMIYLHMRLFQEPELTVEAVLQEYYSAFGPAAQEVREYFDYWEVFSERVVNEHNWPVWGFAQVVRAPRIYTTAVFQPANEILQRAEQKLQQADDAEFAERVNVLQMGLEHAQLCMQFISSLDNGRVRLDDRQKFLASQQAYQRLQDLRKKNAHLPFADLTKIASLEKGIKGLDALEKEFEQVQQAAPEKLPVPWSAWLFRKDPEETGLQEQWYRSEISLEGWREIAVPAFWADTWVGDFQGYAWYRTTFKLPAGWKDLPLNLEFGAVDEQAWVYVNGRAVGEHTTTSEKMPFGSLWDRPFSITVPAEILLPGEENVLVIRVHNAVSNGGIHKEISGHAPHPEGRRPLPNRP